MLLVATVLSGCTFAISPLMLILIKNEPVDIPQNPPQFEKFEDSLFEENPEFVACADLASLQFYEIAQSRQS